MYRSIIMPQDYFFLKKEQKDEKTRNILYKS